MLCSHCGKEIPGNVKFCAFCGGAVGQNIPKQENTQEFLGTQSTPLPKPKEKWKEWRVLRIIMSVILVIAAFAGGMYCAYFLMSRDIETLIGDELAIQGGSYREQIEALTQQLDTAQINHQTLTQNIDDLQQQNGQLEENPGVTFYTPEYIINGLQVNEEGSNSVAVIDSRAYIAADMLEALVNWPTTFDKINNVLTLGDEDQTITKIDVLDTDIMYDGNRYEVYQPSEGKTFTMGGQNFTKGFVVTTNQRSVAYTLFNLDGKYSSLSFDVGRIANSSDYDLSINVYLNDELTNTYNVLSSAPITSIEIPLNYARSLKLELVGSGFSYEFNTDTSYGLTNIILNR